MTDEELGELEMQKEKNERAVSGAFLQYLSGTGVFRHWEENRVAFESIHVRDCRQSHLNQ